MFRRSLLAVVLLVGLAAGPGCATTRTPEVRMLGVNSAPRRDVVFVQVTNPASRPMRLTKLEYTFAAHGSTVATGEVPLRRDVPAGAAVVVEVPLEGGAEGELTLRGTLTAELDQVVRIFTVSTTTTAR